jgi:hypothetical protein
MPDHGLSLRKQTTGGVMAIHVQCAGCGGRFQTPEKLAGKRVKCPKCGQPLAVPGRQHAIARPAGDLDLEQLLGAGGGPAVMPRAPLAPARKKKRSSNTGLIIGLSVGAGGAVLVLSLVCLLWPSGGARELAKEDAARGGQSQVAGEAMPASTATGPNDSATRRDQGLVGADIAGLPDIDDPFDVEQFGTVEIDPADNAYTLYKEAAGLLVKPSGISASDSNRADQEGWSGATEPIRKWVVDNRPAMNVWRKGTEKPEAVYYQPKNLRQDTLLPVVKDLREFVRLAKLEGSRLEIEGKPAEAWQWYRAIFRGSRHCGMHGTLIERIAGIGIHATAGESLSKWAANPTVDADMLRRAIADVSADYKMTAPASTTLKVEYLILMKICDDPEQVAQLMKLKDVPGFPRMNRARGLDSKSESELSRRVTKHVFANLLPQIDKPPQARTKHRAGGAMLFDPEPGGKTPTIPFEDLERHFAQSGLAQWLLPTIRSHIETLVGREQAEQSCLMLMLAAQTYYRDHGELPEKAEDLVPGYLHTLPPDPYGKTGETLRYRRDQDRATAWSVGQNGIDDGGQVARGQREAASADIGFEFESPKG